QERFRKESGKSQKFFCLLNYMREIRILHSSSEVSFDIIVKCGGNIGYARKKSDDDFLRLFSSSTGGTYSLTITPFMISIIINACSLGNMLFLVARS
ncbi:unnamed protein product, partial [Heterotrigona itama]